MTKQTLHVLCLCFIFYICTTCENVESNCRLHNGGFKMKVSVGESLKLIRYFYNFCSICFLHKETFLYYYGAL